MQTVPPDNQMADEGKLLFKEIFQLKSKEGMIMIELKHHHFGTSLLAQWLKIRLPMQGTQVRALLWEDPTCHGATKLVRQNYWACTLEPASDNYWSPRATTTEAHVPRAGAQQQENPPQWEARIPQRREAPARRNEGKPTHSNEDPTQPKINKLNK